MSNVKSTNFTAGFWLLSIEILWFKILGPPTFVWVARPSTGTVCRLNHSRSMASVDDRARSTTQPVAA